MTQNTINEVFDPFGDYQIRGYLRNTQAEMDRSIMRKWEHAVYVSNIVSVVGCVRKNNPITYKTLLNTHRQIFGTVYPWAGSDRSNFNIAICKGGYQTLFAHPLSIQRAAEYAISRASVPSDLGKNPGEIFGFFAHAHPFLDGNGRTILTVYSELCRRAGFLIDWPEIPKSDFLVALTKELLNPSAGHLDSILRSYMKEVKLSARKMAQHLSDNFGRP
jgi:cell filamentation protein